MTKKRPSQSRFSREIEYRAQLMRELAQTKYGNVLISNADDTFVEAFKSGDISLSDSTAILKSSNIYNTCVEWYLRTHVIPYSREFLTEVLKGPDFYEEDRPDLSAIFRIHPDPIPSNLAAVRSVGSRSGPDWGKKQKKRKKRA